MGYENDPLGHEVKEFGGIIVGVLEDFYVGSIFDEQTPVIYFVTRESTEHMYLTIRLHEIYPDALTQIENQLRTLLPDEDVVLRTYTDRIHLTYRDTERFRELLTSFLASIPYPMRRKGDERERERYFHYTFYLILRLMSIYTVYTEKEQSQGRVDCIIETDHFVYVFEFKLDGTADAALRQIEEKGYALPYAADKRKLYKIGVNFSSETGTIDDWQVVG